MSDTENDPLDQVVIDPPENQGGGTKAAVSLEPVGGDVQNIDPPENQGGGDS